MFYDVDFTKTFLSHKHKSLTQNPLGLVAVCCLPPAPAQPRDGCASAPFAGMDPSPKARNRGRPITCETTIDYPQMPQLRPPRRVASGSVQTALRLGFRTLIFFLRQSLKRKKHMQITTEYSKFQPIIVV